ncbi:putative DNA-binding transcriptional regulator YafY [Nocardioides aromaticivorans]|uniref:Putative DNA-binding transcriptional regulator YafY n=1 Tax=Nocardioides aromaticivorans TaxID=200618 RepID=A0A7Y9ZDY9_9ACTN|nr:YafY family protein [Nocardioides aromaticivorans]NYI43684.1 putative DNA-binding transcriptional regulator YafY [Nocardioides aromaticivorans]
MSTSARMLRLLSLLQTHRFWTGGELAGRLEVSERTLRRDVERLRDLGYDVDAVRGAAGGYQLRAGGAMAPLLLEEDEAVAVAVGLRAAANGGVPGFEDTTLQALTKVIALMPPRLRRRMAALQTQTEGMAWAGGPALDPAVLTTLAQACRDDEAVSFAYTAADGSATVRRVEPHRLVNLGRRWYLAAYDRDRQDWRSFRVDRVEGTPTTSGQRFRPREIPGGDAAAYVSQGLRTRPRQHRVVVTMAVPAATAEASVGRWASIEPLGEDRCRMTMDTDTLDWPVLVLAGLDCDFEVEAPDELHALLARFAARISR